MANEPLTPDPDENADAGEASAKTRLRRKKRSTAVSAPGGKLSKKLHSLFSRGTKKSVTVENQPNSTADKPDEATISKEEHLARRLEQLEDESWEIRESEEIHRSLLEAFGDIVLHRTNDGTITFRNAPFVSLFGDIDHIEELALDYSLAENTVDPSNEHATRDLNISTAKGERWFSWTDLPIRDEQTGLAGIRTVARDITERKKAEDKLAEALHEAERANETKSRFLAMVSHEIRTPLNGVLGMAQLLKKTSLDPHQLDYVEAIETSGHSLSALIEDLLDTSRIEAGELRLDVDPFDIVALVESVAALVAPRAQAKSLPLATYVSPTVPRQLAGDGPRLKQVLVNLLGNAVKFTAAGGVSLTVERDENISPDNTVRLYLAVKDSGPGMSADDCDHIFDEFYQSDNSQTRSHGGAGLGLAIVKRIVNLMDGDVTVESDEDSGTIFRVTVAIAVAKDKLPETRSPAVQLDQGVVVVLPDSPARAALVQAIRATGRTCAAFTTAAQLPEKLSRDFSTIIVSRPRDRDADCLIVSLKEAGFDNLLCLAAQAGPEEAASIRGFGFDGWLTWPVRSATLRDVLTGTAGTRPTTETETTALPAKPTNTNQIDALLAEDNAINALLAKSLLKKLGHTVTHVTDGAQAVLAATDNVFDVILMDLHMPFMDGTAAITAIRKGEIERGDTPTRILVLSADGQQSAREAAMAAGADGFLVKPLDLEAVTAMLYPAGEDQRKSA